MNKYLSLPRKKTKLKIEEPASEEQPMKKHKEISCSDM
jgi:hypothetical protein